VWTCGQLTTHNEQRPDHNTGNSWSDFIYRMVTIFRFDHMIGENQQSIRPPDWLSELSVKSLWSRSSKINWFRSVLMFRKDSKLHNLKDYRLPCNTFRKVIKKKTIGLVTFALEAKLIVVCFFVFLNSTLGKQECRPGRFVHSILHLNGISNQYLFWMVSTALFRISTKTSYYERADIYLVDKKNE